MASTQAKPSMDDLKKRKADDKADAAPKKEAKTDVAKTGSKTKKDNDSGETEKNALKDTRPLIQDTVQFHASDCTLNVLPVMGSKMLMALSEGGMQYLIAGARASVGIKAGRYMYEVKIVEALNPAEATAGARGRVPVPRQLVRLGFSTDSAPLVLSESDDSIYLDSEGYYISGKGKKAATSQRFTREQTMAVLLNLDPKSPNCNTISLFRDGERITDPQKLPETLVGKTLFPHVSFRNVSVQVHFGPQPARALPFQCRMIQGAAKNDVEVNPALAPVDGKFEVMIPVAFPDEGTFDWLDDFLEKNPHYVELSDRKILEWATLSGLWKPKGTSTKASNDKPEFNFNLPSMDDFSVRRIINTAAPLVPRDYVIMEVKANLIAEERKEVLARFSVPHFKKVAHVVMGEPTEEYKSAQHSKLLQEKQERVTVEWKAKKAEEERKKALELRQQQLIEMRKKADEQRKKALEDAKRKRDEELKKKEEEKKAKEQAEKGEAGEGGTEAEVKDEEEAKTEGTAPMDTDAGAEVKDETKDEVNEEEEKKDEEEEKKEEGPPVAELTEEEQKMWFRPVSVGGTPDLQGLVLNQSFSQFSIPDLEEGFDDIRYEWQDAAKSRDYLRNWVQERKRTSRVEDLQPGAWFEEKLKEWLQLFPQWQAKQKEYKNSAAKKAKDEAKKAEEERRRLEMGGEEGKDADMEEGDTLDIFSVEDINDIGEGEPLFSNLTFEDWALLQLRFELYMLQLAFKRDVDDPERIGVHDSHLAFYYHRYFRKQLTPKHFGVNTNTELCKLVKDTVKIDEETMVLSAQLAEETEDIAYFVKATEEARRERQRRIDAGDETARVKFTPMAMQQAQLPSKAATIARSAMVSGAAAAATASAWARQANAGAQQWGSAAGFARWPAAQPTYGRPYGGYR